MILSPAILEMAIRARPTGAEIQEATTVGLVLGKWRPDEIRALAARADDLRDDLLDGLARYLILRDRADFLGIAGFVDRTGHLPGGLDA